MYVKGCSDIYFFSKSINSFAKIDCVIAGERNIEKLAKLCDERIQKTKMEDVRKSLEGIYKTEELFALQHAYDEYQFYISQIAKCDKEIEKVLQKVAKEKPEVNTEKKI